jgi:hypothetical protein
MLPPRIKRDSGKKDAGRRSPGHRAWVRQHACCGCGATAPIECAHVRTGTDGGMGFKPSDWWTISLCKDCHHWQTINGEQPFEARTGIDMKALAREFIRKSPHRHKLIGWEAAQ